MRLEQLTHEERKRVEEMWTSDRDAYVLLRSKECNMMPANVKHKYVINFEADEELLKEIVSRMLEAKVPVVDELPWL